MENPLTEEQQKRLVEISKLDPESQKKEWNEFVKTLSKEQVEFLQKQQTRCPFCSIIKKEIKAYVVYEDENVMGVLDINPANKGHVILFPLEHCENLQDLKEVEHIFSVAKQISEAMVKGLQIKGTNILIANGMVAGQLVPHFAIHIIPRSEGDGINFMWNAKKISDEEMQDAAEKIKSNIGEEVVEVEEKAPEVYEEIERIP